MILAQYVFLGLYLATEAVVMILYHRSKVVPQWAMLFLALSNRLYSIYYLRLFNESVLMLPVYLSLCHSPFLLDFSLVCSLPINNGSGECSFSPFRSPSK